MREFAESSLAAGISAGATTLTVLSGHGDTRFADVVPGDELVVHNATDYDSPADAFHASPKQCRIVRVTSRAGDLFQIEPISEAVDLVTGGKVYSVRLATSEGNLRRARRILDLQDLGGDPTGVEDVEPALQRAASLGGTLVIPPGTFSLQTSIVLPPTLHLESLEGGEIRVETGVTLTVSGVILNGPRQIFDPVSAGTISLPTWPLVESVRPEWFGATRDGTTDDTAALTKALAFSLSSQNPVPVRLSAGRYRATQLLVPDDAGKPVRLVGEGWRHSEIRQLSSAGGLALIRNTNSGGMAAPQIEGLHLRGATDGSGGHLVFMEDVRGFSLEDCYLEGAGTNSALLRLAQGCSFATIRHVRIHGRTAKHGLWIGRTSDAFGARPNGIWISDVSSWDMSSAEGFPTGNAFFFDDAGSVRVENVRCEGIGCTAGFMKIRDGKRLYFHRVESVFGAVIPSGIDWDIENTQWITIIECSLGHPTDVPVALDIDNAWGISIRDSQIRGTRIELDAGCHSVEIENSDFYSGLQFFGSDATGDKVRVVRGRKISSGDAFQERWNVQVSRLVTILSGAIAVGEGLYSVGTQGGAGSDDLDTVDIPDGELVTLRAAVGGEVVNVVGGGNITLLGGTLALDTTIKSITLRGTQTGGALEVSRST